MMMSPGLPMQSPQKEVDLSDIEIPLFIEPFKAWRCWTVSVESNIIRLKSITHKVKWPYRKPMRAHCIYQWRKRRLHPEDIRYNGIYNSHSAPNLKHGCGIYSTREKRDTNLWVVNSAQTQLRVIGEVKLWGKTLCFEKGFVSEFAYPTSLFINPDGWDRLKPEHKMDITPYELMNELSVSYDVPVIIDET